MTCIHRYRMHCLCILNRLVCKFLFHGFIWSHSWQNHLPVHHCVFHDLWTASAETCLSINSVCAWHDFIAWGPCPFACSSQTRPKLCSLSGNGIRAVALRALNPSHKREQKNGFWAQFFVDVWWHASAGYFCMVNVLLKGWFVNIYFEGV